MRMIHRLTGNGIAAALLGIAALSLLPVRGWAQCGSVSQWGDVPAVVAERAAQAHDQGGAGRLKAIDILRCAIELARSGSQADSSFLFSTYYQLGHYLQEVGQHDEAISAFGQGRAEIASVPDSVRPAQAQLLLAEGMLAMAVSNHALGKMELARAMTFGVMDSLMRRQGWSHPSTVAALDELGSILLDMGDLDGAIKAGRRAWRTSTADQQQARFVAAGMLSEAFLEMGFPDSALRYTLAVGLPGNRDMAPPLLQLLHARSLTLSGKLREGTAFFEGLMQVADTNGQCPAGFKARAYVEFAEDLHRKGRDDAALQYLQCALMEQVPQFSHTSAETNPDSLLWSADTWMFRGFLAKAGCFAALGRTENAIQAYDLAFRHLHHLRLRLHDPIELANLERIEVGAYEEALDFALNLRRSTGKREYVGMSLDIMERSKLESMLAAVRKMEVQDVALRRPVLWRQWRFQIAEVRRFLDSGNPAPRIELARMDSLRAMVFPVSDRLARFALMRPPEVRKQLHHGELLVEYFLGDHTLHLVAIDSAQYDVAALEMDKDFQTSLSKLFQSIYSEPGDDVRSWGRFAPHSWRIYDAVSRSLHGAGFLARPPKLLTVIPDMRYGFLPLEALLTSPMRASQAFIQADYLGRYCAVRYGSAVASILERDRNHFDRPQMGAMAFAASPRRLPELKDADDEAATATQRFEKSVRRRGASANRRAFQQMAAEFRILHFACHVRTDSLSQTTPWIALERAGGETDTLGALDLCRDTLFTELAVMTQTDLGRHGAQVPLMARAFQVAGCPTTVMGLCPLGKRSATPMIDRFYSHLKGGVSASQSLLQSRVAYLHDPWLADNPRWAHPHYWATLVTIGDEGPHLPQYEVNYQRWIIWGCVIAVLVAYLQRRRRTRRKKTRWR